MLGKCFESEKRIARLRAGPAGRYLDGFAAYLLQRRYTPITAQKYIYSVVHLMRLATPLGVKPETLTQDLLRDFGDNRFAPCSCRRRPRSRARCLKGPLSFLEYLSHEGVIPPGVQPTSRGLEKYFNAKRCIARLRDGPAGRYLDGFADHLDGLGFNQDTGQKYIQSVVHMMRLPVFEGVAIEMLGDEHIGVFRRHLAKCRCQRPRGDKCCCSRAQRFLEYLRQIGTAKPRPVPQEPALITRFCEWMRRHRGSSNVTLRGYCSVLRAFLSRVGDYTNSYDAPTLRSFVLDYGRGKGKLVPQAMRQFLRFLVAEGLCPAGLSKAIPTVAHWRLSSLPRYLPSDDVERVIAAASNSARDRAMLLLMSRLGLRNGDICELRLGDVDWQRGRIRVVGKSHREALLPLPQDVGDALLAYVETERPEAPSDHVFFTRVAPVQPIGRDTARNMVRSSLRRAGIDAPPSRGCHLLRHSAATDMLRRGMPLEDIGVLLRHRFRETTEIYAKVDIDALRLVAQPWPLETI